MASADDDPARKAEMADSLSLAFLVMLESLSPEQRAAFLLREVFDEPYGRIAEIIGTSEQMPASSPPAPADTSRSDALGRGLARAAGGAEPLLRRRRGGDLEGLEKLLAHDVVSGDGGGKAPAATRAIHGRAKVARALTAGLRAATPVGGFTWRREEVNGQPGALFYDREGGLMP